MAVVALKQFHKISPTFAYPESGRVRVYIEASFPVDIVLSSAADVSKIDSLQTAASLAPPAMIYSRTYNFDQIIILRPEWKTGGWAMTIGHPSDHAECVGVYFAVFPA
jgi:hypothetical protein